MRRPQSSAAEIARAIGVGVVARRGAAGSRCRSRRRTGPAGIRSGDRSSTARSALPATSSDANTVPTSRLTCATEEREQRRQHQLARPCARPGGCRPSCSRGRRPSRASAGHSNTNCSTPATSTPQASADGRHVEAAAPATASRRSSPRLCSTGVNAGSANLRKLLSTPRRQRGHRDEQQVREGDPQHVRRSARTSPARRCRAGREQPAITGAQQHAQRRDHHQHHRHSAPAMWSTKSFSAASSPLLLDLGEHRHEGRRERAFGEDPPQEVGDAVGDDEGARSPAPAPNSAACSHVADEAGDPRQQGHAR